MKVSECELASLALVTNSFGRGKGLDGRFFGLVPARSLYGRAIAVYHRRYHRRDQGLRWKKL